MKPVFTLLLAVLCGVSATDVYAQRRAMPAKVFRQLMKNPAQFPKARLSELSNRQLDHLIGCVTSQMAPEQRRHQQELLRQTHVFDVSRPAIFRAISNSGTDLYALSGTVFQITHAGQTEIFGAVPMHILQNLDHTPGSLSKDFSAAIQTPDGVKIIPAQIVQLSSSKTGDIALVKFRPKDETLLSPLVLTSAVHQFPQVAYAQGFAHKELTQASFSLVGTTSAGALVAQIPAANPGERAGFCGSPVLTQQATLAGIHVGSNYTVKDPSHDIFFSMFKLPEPVRPIFDVGYITPASFLRQLVAAYHTPSLKPVSVKLAGQEITRLAIDEYVSDIELLDANLQVIWQKSTHAKVTFTPAEMAIRAFPHAVFVRLYIGKTHWAQGEKGPFVQDTDYVSSVLKCLIRR